MTTPTPPTKPALNIRAIISVVETVAFVVATVLQTLGYGHDAVTTALIGLIMHGANHPAGGSPI